LTVRVVVSLVDAPKPEDLAPAIVMRTKRAVAMNSAELEQMQNQQQQ
jgi:hypothetical protein